ncbi:MAG TPA: hydroxymethylbilane synthase [Syntrophales bacterium]|nr:hydroxymethylbilane synthase [Syntrophales bacterium]HPC00594.1 hydroxymethylbilane synthase [Syntrophales bacterium]HRS86528.1 hydroxymethylbilane synthase [Syntrophales bacterium]HRV42188.1 hydroxymethylbilane synthase [Syntrophales bacterium]
MTVRIGTRGSPLALAQTEWVRRKIEERHPRLKVETVIIKTKGDIMQDVALVRIGGKGVFVKEIEDALLKGEIDLAVHSLKDVPAELPEGLVIAVTPEREDPRDVLVSRGNVKFERLRRGARIGTSSLRRRCQLLAVYPDLEIVPLRGNLDTRLRKVEVENLDGVVVAAAGMRRMGWLGRVSHFLPPETLLPAVGQGVLAIETRAGDAGLIEDLQFLHSPRTGREAGAERAFLRRLGGGCQLPVAALAEEKGDSMVVRGLLGSPDGRLVIRREVRGPAHDYLSLGERLAEEILAGGGKGILAVFYPPCR